MDRQDMIITLIINHMEDRRILETMTNKELKELMDYYHEEY